MLKLLTIQSTGNVKKCAVEGKPSVRIRSRKEGFISQGVTLAYDLQVSKEPD